MNILRKSISEVISDSLFEFQKNPRNEALFVFPTEIEKNSWIDWAVRNPNESGVSAVNTERFIAWDEFKRCYAAAETQKDGKTCIPSLMRKVFAEKLLQENAKNHFIKQIISRDLTGDALFGFTDWLSKILPSLRLWKKQYDNTFLQNVKNGTAFDDAENEDFNTLFSLYNTFLNNHNFYEPSFFEPNFKGNGTPVFIFYPEINEDYAEYIETLSKSDDIFIIPVPETRDSEHKTEKKDDFFQHCILYPDSRIEIRRVVLKIRKLWLSGVDLNRIALSVPDLENIRPYIEREFRLYAVPAYIRNGTPFTRNSGGDIFKKIKDCIDNNFSFESMRSLLNDGFLPWKKPDLHLELIQAGIKFRCIYSVDDEYDIWEKTLEGKKDCSSILSYYKKLKAAIEKFNTKNCKSFENLENAWAYFREEFIDSVKFKSIWQKEMNKAEYTKHTKKIEELENIKGELERYDLTDRILGQMITTLSDFSCLEQTFCKEFPNEGKTFGLNKYLDFFVNEMDSSSYAVNEKKAGVNIFSYKVAACADFDYHFIINANQNDITVPLNTLKFITDDEKREKFGLEKNDASEKFIALYSAQNRLAKQKEVFWSAAKVNFTGAAITHTALKEFDVTEAILHLEAIENLEHFDEKLDTQLKSTFKKFDFIVEKNHIVDSLDSLDFIKQEIPHTFSSQQKKAFEIWKSANATMPAKDNSLFAIPEHLKQKIDKYVERQNGLVSISASKLNSFFPCQKKWLFQNVMGIGDEKFSPRLAETNEIGTFYHKALENLFLGFGEKIPIYTENDLEEIEKRICNAINKAFTDEKICSSDVMSGALSKSAFTSQLPIIKKTLMDFVRKICAPPLVTPDGEIESNGSYGGWTIEGLEMKRIVEKEQFKCNGYIDCLLTKNGDPESAVIVDYKTGHVPTASESIVDADGKIANFQMAMYVYLLENKCILNEKIYKIKESLFYSLQEKSGEFKTNYVIAENPSPRSSVVKREDFKETLETFQIYLTNFTESIKQYKFMPSKKYNDKNYVNPNSDCIQCKFKSICRTSFNVGKKEI
ncbi:MAG: PD-(D/E)XK nuclease family protein [Treponemataceae bacterium]|nr:PD-(D/E)XK nuclease family protein [Treponemataceae bacterium]